MLTDEQVRSYWDAGYVNRVRALDAAEAGSFVERLREIVRGENARHCPLPLFRGLPWWRARSFDPRVHGDHPLKAWSHEIIRHPAVSSAASSILGEAVFAGNADLVVARPFRWAGHGWHRDRVAPYEDAGRALTVWLGLTPSHPGNGCVWFVPGSHRAPSLPPSVFDRLRRRDPELRSGLGHLPRKSAVPNAMAAGEISLHHPRIVHGTGINRTASGRIGFVIRLFSADADPEAIGAGEGILLRGTPLASKIRALDAVPFRWES